jgi:hypothetical protein
LELSNNNINEFLKWSYILSYLNIKDEDYYFADNVLIVKRIEIFSKVCQETQNGPNLMLDFFQ